MKLNDWMSAEGLTDEGAAALVGVDRTTVSRIRRGLTQPSWELAATFKVVSGGVVTADDFLPEVAG